MLRETMLMKLLKATAIIVLYKPALQRQGKLSLWLTPCHEGTYKEWRLSKELLLTLALNVCHFTPRERTPITHYTGEWWAPEPA
jgi:hypothetical protein